MAKSPSRTPLIAAVILVLVTLAGFNALSEKYRPKSEHELEAEASKAQQEAAGKSGADGKAATPAAPSAGTGASELVNLGSDAVVGDTNGKSTITVGWSWTPEVQGDPNKVLQGIRALKQAAPNAKIRMVNTDEVTGVPDGVSVGGNVVVPLGGDGSLPPAADAYKGVATVPSAGGAEAPK